jgi:hypothetical protein
MKQKILNIIFKHSTKGHMSSFLSSVVWDEVADEIMKELEPKISDKPIPPKSQIIKEGHDPKKKK